MRIKLPLVCALVLVGMALGVSPAAYAQAGPTLASEFLLGSTGFFTFDGDVVCNPAGTSTLTASATGFAFGPFPGTFEESVTVQVSGGVVTKVDATFRIDSADTVVTGTKSLSAPGGAGFCGLTTLPSSGSCLETIVFASSVIVDYAATITGPSGSSTESGTASLGTPSTFQRPCGASGGVVFGQINEFFLGPVGGAGAHQGATGGGEIRRTVTDTPVTFGFNASEDARGAPKGSCSVLDHATGTHVVCLDVTSYVQTGKHAVFSGNARVDGMLTTYRIDVLDGGTSGAGEDTFAIETGTGFVAGGVLIAGNVTVHE